jgi:hypothetical protein
MKRSLALFALVWCAVPLFAAVSGTVMTPDGQAISGARVSIYSIESPEARRTRLLSATPDQVPLFSTQTDSKGSFSLESPKENVTELRVTARGYEPASRRIERDEEAGAIALTRAETKRGTVKANGKPVANAAVVLSYNGAEYLVKTDAEGRYEVPDPKHARTITIVHPDFTVLEDTSQSFREGITNLDRVLAAAAPLAGHVVRDDGKTPVAKATVFVNGWPLATSGDDGAFTIARAPVKWTMLTAQTATLVGTRAQTTERPITIRVAKPATISGRILDSKTKLPVAGASVRTNVRGAGMMRMGGDSSWWGATSDAKGNYSFTAAPGSYMLMATHPAYELSSLDLTAAAGQSATKEIALTPLARVSGVVVNDEKKPVVAAAISTQNAGELDFTNVRTMMAPNATTVSGPDGRFSFRVRTDADLKLRAAKKGFPPATSEAVKFAPGERRGNFVLTIPSGVEVTGKVTDASGTALSGVSVVATPTPAGQRGMVMRMVIGALSTGDEETVKTASDGTYSIRVTEGNQDFAFKREGFSTKNVRGKSVTVAGPNIVDASLDPSVEISGRVVRGGTGVEGVYLTSFGFGGGDTAEAVSGPDGSFTLRGLSSGSTRLMIRKEDDLVNEQRQLTAPGRDVVIELPVGVRVSGRVMEKSTKKPVTNFQVGVSASRSGGGMVMMMPPMMRSMTSDDGSFVLDNVPLGAINFMASAPGYTTTRMNLNIEEGKPVTNLEVELDTGVRLVGKITGPDGSALADANVSLAMIGGPGMNVARATDKRTVTNSSGEYELDALEPGEETLEISHSKYLTERKTVELKGREMRLDVQLSAGNRVSGVVVSESGGPVAEADVEAMAAGGMPRRVKSDSGGRFEFDSLSPARYQISASKAGFVEATLKDVDVAAAGAPMRLVLKSGGTIYGYVRGLSAEELTTTTVDARGAESSATSTVDANGAYRLEGVPAGTVTVRAMMMGRGFSSRKVSPSQVVEMAPGESRQLDLEYRSDTVIKGRVRRNGQPLSGASVLFFPRQGSSAQSSASTTADEQGNYSVSGLEDGEYSVMVNDMQRFTSHTTTYEVRGSATFDIDHDAYTVRGRVVNSATGDPISEARVSLRGAGNSAAAMRFAERVAITDANGTFSLELVSAGSYLLNADRQGFGNDPHDITISNRALEDFELRLQPSDGATLKVVDQRDGSVLRARVVVFDMQGRVMNPDRFMFGDAATETTISLSAGQYQATISALGYGTRQISLRAPSNQTIGLTPAARLAIRSKHSEVMNVRLIDSNGWAYPRWDTIPPSRRLLANPATTTIDDIGSGTYTLQLLGANGVVLDSKQVTLEDGQTVEVDI